MWSREKFREHHPAHTALEAAQQASAVRAANRATLAVARKLVAYMVAVDRRQKDFLTVERENRTAA
jgi:hypothetical protein